MLPEHNGAPAPEDAPHRVYGDAKYPLPIPGWDAHLSDIQIIEKCVYQQKRPTGKRDWRRRDAQTRRARTAHRWRRRSAMGVGRQDGEHLPRCPVADGWWVSGANGASAHRAGAPLGAGTVRVCVIHSQCAASRRWSGQVGGMSLLRASEGTLRRFSRASRPVRYGVCANSGCSYSVASRWPTAVSRSPVSDSVMFYLMLLCFF